MAKMEQVAPQEGQERRGFFKRLLAVVLGSVAIFTPLVAGLAFVLDPLKRKSGASDKLRITNLDALPADGRPVKFPIMASRVDAWNKLPNTPVGAIYLRKVGEKQVQAFNVVCPHAGCFVDYRGDMNSFFCPCHNSAFGLNGEITDKKSPSPRGLDSLEVEVRGNEVWVRFQNFQTGKAQKVPVA